eukprot:266620-Amorphochlora_amoeboformis.AAC.2
MPAEGSQHLTQSPALIPGPSAYLCPKSLYETTIVRSNNKSGRNKEMTLVGRLRDLAKERPTESRRRGLAQTFHELQRCAGELSSAGIYRCSSAMGVLTRGRHWQMSQWLFARLLDEQKERDRDNTRRWNVRRINISDSYGKDKNRLDAAIFNAGITAATA